MSAYLQISPSTLALKTLPMHSTQPYAPSGCVQAYFQDNGCLLYTMVSEQCRFHTFTLGKNLRRKLLVRHGTAVVIIDGINYGCGLIAVDW
jgi:hypothetical protein